MTSAPIEVTLTPGNHHLRLPVYDSAGNVLSGWTRVEPCPVCWALVTLPDPGHAAWHATVPHPHTPGPAVLPGEHWPRCTICNLHEAGNPLHHLTGRPL